MGLFSRMTGKYIQLGTGVVYHLKTTQCRKRPTSLPTAPQKEVQPLPGALPGNHQSKKDATAA